MGDDPKTAVVSRYCQSHDVDNLFIADGSVLVTDAGFNPSSRSKQSRSGLRITSRSSGKEELWRTENKADFLL